MNSVLDRLQMFALCLMWIATFTLLAVASLINPEWAKSEAVRIARFIANRQAERKVARMDAKWRAF